jgi:hypothetical protein
MQTSILAAIATAKVQNRFLSVSELQAEEERLTQDLVALSQNYLKPAKSLLSLRSSATLSSLSLASFDSFRQ